MYKRLITGLVLIVLAVLCVFFLPFIGFFIFTSLLTLLAAWEWGLLIDCQKRYCRYVYMLCVAFAMFCAWQAPIKPILYASLIWWLIALYFIIRYPKDSKLWGEGVWMRGCAGIFTLVPCWVAINTIRVAQDGLVALFFMLLLVWGADSGAYFAGVWWGKHSLMPNVSPKKTWQGLFGGLLLVLLIAFLACFLMDITLPHWPTIMGIALVTGVFSAIGDLLESMLKRRCGIKDTGSYLPGHGGILVRMDSLTAAVPLFLLGCLLFGFRG